MYNQIYEKCVADEPIISIEGDITHDGTNLTKDVENISGKVGDWVDFLGGFKVYPVLQVRFTKTIF